MQRHQCTSVSGFPSSLCITLNDVKMSLSQSFLFKFLLSYSYRADKHSSLNWKVLNSLSKILSLYLLWSNLVLATCWRCSSCIGTGCHKVSWKRSNNMLLRALSGTPIGRLLPSRSYHHFPSQLLEQVNQWVKLWGEWGHGECKMGQGRVNQVRERGRFGSSS